MTRFSDYQIARPKKWQDFESLCQDLWRSIWEDPNTKKNGRAGQSQHGVDIYGRPQLGNDWAGIQCKGKDGTFEDTKITEVELLREVEKAKKFSPNLSQWILVTTCKKDSFIEALAREITDEHLQKGLFSVDVWFWDDIVSQLDSFTDVAKRHFGNSFSDLENASSGELDERLTQILSSLDGIPNRVVAEIRADSSMDSGLEKSELSADIEYAKGLIRNGKASESINFLQHIKTKKWETLSSESRYTLLANIGIAHYKLDHSEEAKSFLIEALTFNPEDGKALANVALAYQCNKDLVNAESFARKAIRKDRNNPTAYCVLLSLPKYQNSLSAALKLVPNKLHKNTDVAHSFGWISINEKDFESARAWFEVAFERDSQNHPTIQAAMGMILLPNNIQEFIDIQDTTDEDKRSRIVRSVELLSAAWDQVKDTELRARSAVWLLNRGVGSLLLGEREKADRDFIEALSLEPDNPEFIRHAAQASILRKDFDEAISLFSRIPEANRHPDASIILSELLHAKGRSDEAAKLLQNVLKHNLPQPIREDAAQSLLSLYLEENQLQQAQDVLKEFDESTTITAHISRSRVARFKGDGVTALSILDDVKRLLDPASFPRELTALAEEFKRNKEYSSAADCFRQNANISTNSEQTRALLWMDYYAGNLSEALTISSGLRHKYGILQTITDIEIASLEEINDLESAIKLCEEYLETFPDALPIRLRHAWNSYRLLDFESVDNFLKKDRLASEFDLEDGGRFAHLIAVRKGVKESIKFLYEIRRTYYDQADAHLLYATAFFGYEKDRGKWLSESLVTSDCAVCIIENNGEKEWFVIEGRTATDFSKNELSMSHPMSLAMSGKSVGDEFVINSRQPSDRVAKILEIKSKYLYALHETMEKFEKLFPGHGGLWQVHIGTQPHEIEESSKQFYDQASRDIKKSRDLYEIYFNEFLTIGAYCNLGGNSSLQTWINLIHNPAGVAICSVGEKNEYSDAVSAASLRPRLAVDLTSLYLLFELNLGELVVSAFGELLIAPTTLDEMQGLIIETQAKQTSGYSVIGESELGYVWHEFTPEFVKGRTRLFEEFLAWIQRYCKVSPYLNGLNLPRSEKMEWREALRKDFFDTVFIAKNSEYVLLSEDLRLRQWADQMHGVKGIWLQPLLVSLKESGHISVREYSKYAAKLATYRMTFVSIDASVLVEAARNSGWKIDYSFLRVIERLGLPGAELSSSLEVITDFFVSLLLQDITQSRHLWMYYIALSALTINNPAEIVIPRLKATIETRFRSHPTMARNFIGIVEGGIIQSSIIPFKFLRQLNMR